MSARVQGIPDVSKPSILQIDNLDDRREVYFLLHRLPPDRRLAFMDWCCSRIVAPGGTRPTPSRVRMAETIAAAWKCSEADERLTGMLYGDFLLLGSQWALDLVAAALELEQWVRRPGDRRPSAGPCTSAVAASRTAGSSGSAHPPVLRSARTA